MLVSAIDTFELRELIGGDATEREAVEMLRILERNDIRDTDDVNDAQWLEWVDEAVEIAGRTV